MDGSNTSNYKFLLLKDQVIDILPLGTILISVKSGKILEVNEQFAQWCDYDSPDDIIGLNVYDMLIDNDARDLKKFVLNGGVTKSSTYTTYITPKGNQTLLLTYYLVYNENLYFGMSFLMNKRKLSNNG